MTKTEFTPEDFLGANYGDSSYLLPLDHAVRQANTKLPEIKEAWLEELKKSAVKVYGSSAGPNYVINWTVNKVSTDTHSALLIGIQPIEKKCRVHNYNVCKEDASELDYHATCDNCGYKLKASWSEE